MSKITQDIDAENAAFTEPVRAQLLHSLPQASTEYLEWLMAEHYQFSRENTRFLAMAAERTQPLLDGAVQAELQRNLAEESGHAAAYKLALKDIGVDVDKRQPFAPTAAFFNLLDTLLQAPPEAVLGAMYATETAAIFEHQVFREVSLEVCQRKGVAGRALIRFHDMHLEGVEQSHKDELGVFLLDGPDAPIATAPAQKAASLAILAMKEWWSGLLQHQVAEALAA